MANEYLNLLQAPPAAAPSNPYLDLVQGDEQRRQTQFRAATTLAVDTNPDQAANARRVAAYLGTTPPAVEALPAEAERAAKLKRLQDDTAQAPVLRQRYTDADWAKLAHDDSGILSTLETAVSKAARYITSADKQGGLVRDLVAGVFGASRGAAGVGQAAMELMATRPDPTQPPNRILQAGADWFARTGAEAGATQKALAGQNDGIVSGGVSSGVQSLAQNLLMMPLALLPGGQAAALTGMAGGTGGQAYQDAREKGIAPSVALPFAASQAAIEYATERIPLGKLIGDVKAGTGLLKAMGNNALREIPGEQIATVLQDLNEWAVLNPAKPFSDYMAERPSAAAQTLIATVIGVGGQVSVLHAIQKAADNATGREREAQRAPVSGQALTELAAMAEASKLRERDPAAFATFAQELMDDKVPALHIEARALIEAGVDLGALAQAMPSVAAQLTQAAESGGDIVIPTGEFLAAGPGQTFLQPLIEHARTAADAMSPAEAKVYMQSHGDQLQAEIGRVLTERQGDEAFNASRDAVRDTFAQQLQSAGRAPEVAKTEAALLGNFYATQAARLGITPEEMAARYPLRVQGTVAQGAQVLEQNGAVPADTNAPGQNDGAQGADSGKGTIELFHGSPAAISKIEDKGLFGGIFASARQSSALSHGDVLHRLRLHESEILSQSDIENITDEQLQKAAPWVPAEHIDRLRELVVDDVQAGDGDAEIMRTDDVAEASWEAQRLRGVLARNLGFKAVEMQDEHGRTYLILPGVTITNEPAASDGSDVFSQQARGQIALGADITQQPSVITLLKGADLSTFVHEAGHFFLAAQMDLAARIEAQAREGAGLTDGEQQIVADARTALAWFGMQDTPEQSALAQWHAMPAESQRSHHEQFARGFEAYAFEGRAPTVELQGVFQRFRAWMLAVYKELKALHVELTDDVRGVFDRMLASTEAIRDAEAAKAMGALFGTAEQAGMTPEEWRAYHELGLEATQTAIDNLQARGLRDMKWLANAKSRKLKELQKAAEALRRDARADARAAIMAQPLYRAWQFLTGKGDDIDQAPAAEKAGSSKMLDPGRDSLLVAVAKMGGINRDSAARDAGVHSDYHRTESGVFGMPVFRKTGGLSADDMAAALAEAGYLPLDEFGRHSLHELEVALSDELGGSPRYSYAYNYDRATDDQVPSPLPESALYGKLSTDILRQRYGTSDAAVWRKLSKLRMTSDTVGVDPDVVAEAFGFSGGDELVQALAEATPPAQAIEAETDRLMLERHGDLATPAGLERAVDEALHNDARARFISAELAALERAASVRQRVPGQRRTVDVMAQAARQYADGVVAALRVRDLHPAQYQAGEQRAARAAQQALAKGDTAAAAAAKRDQLIQNAAARAAMAAQHEVARALAYFRRFDKRSKAIDADYMDQIEQLLARFDLRASTTLREVDRRKSLAAWVAAQVEKGLEPDIPDALLDEANRKSAKDMTVEELRGLRDTIKQIEHFGRLKGRLLAAQAGREFNAARDEIADSIDANARGRVANTRTPADALGRALQQVRRFGAAHIKVATWARIMDGGQAGPMWDYFIRPANERGDMEVTMRAEATQALADIMAPLIKGAKMGGKGKHFASINRTLNREQVIAIALNTGNAGNLQRLLGGEGWSIQQLQPVLNTLTSAEWRAVQAIWDHFETYRPAIGAKERRVNGKEPQWIEPQAFDIAGADGVAVSLRGGYYPIKYDPAATMRAEQHADAEAAKRQMQGAYTAATTRRSFTKTRAEEIVGRPLLYSLAGVYAGVNDVIHDLAWHEWLIDTNKFLASDKIDRAIREQYGPEVVKQFKSWVQDIAEGDKGLQAELDGAIGRLRQGVSVAGLGFNAMSAAMQPLGFTQSVVRIGAAWVGKGLAQYIAHPIEATRRVNAASDFMASRSRTRFRELAEIRAQVEGQNPVREFVGQYAYLLMMKAQQTVDIPTWLGAYERAMSEGNTEERAQALADQAVIDAQGGGQTKDLSAIERGGPAQKLFTVFYSFMNTALNIGVGQAMTERSRGKLAADMLMLYSVPAVLGVLLKDALTPGDAGDDDEKSLARKLIAAQIDYLMGLFALVRETSSAVKAVAGVEDHIRDYSGPAGVRLIGDAVQFGKQAGQGEFDDAFRKAAINLAGSSLGLPSAQINRTITGTQALAEGETDNPAAIVFGFQKPR